MKLYAGGLLDFYLPNHRNQVEVELTVPTRLSEILVGLGIPPAEVHLVVLNGELVELEETVVSDRDEVKVFPPVNGG
ncbi:MAG: MoaD/ThiS family protein [Chloroflexota bacterium]|jgi:sulfur carrier protein ThiS